MHAPQGLQSVDKSKPEQGQGQEFIAMLNKTATDCRDGLYICDSKPLIPTIFFLSQHYMLLGTSGKKGQSPYRLGIFSLKKSLKKSLHRYLKHK